jgi:hypothetical protein
MECYSGRSGEGHYGEIETWKTETDEAQKAVKQRQRGRESCGMQGLGKPEIESHKLTLRGDTKNPDLERSVYLEALRDEPSGLLPLGQRRDSGLRTYRGPRDWGHVLIQNSSCVIKPFSLVHQLANGHGTPNNGFWWLHSFQSTHKHNSHGQGPTLDPSFSHWDWTGSPFASLQVAFSPCLYRESSVGCL